MLSFIEYTRQAEAQAMRDKLLVRVLAYAVAHRAKPLWKSRQYAIMYGCRSLPMLSRIAHANDNS